jgi:hypothetical protein
MQRRGVLAAPAPVEAHLDVVAGVPFGISDDEAEVTAGHARNDALLAGARQRRRRRHGHLVGLERARDLGGDGSVDKVQCPVHLGAGRVREAARRRQGKEGGAAGPARRVGAIETRHASRTWTARRPRRTR